MEEDLSWCSAQLLHPFEPDIRVQMWWQEDRNPGVRGTGSPPPSTVTPGASGVGPKRDNQGQGSSSDEGEHYNRCRVPTPWVSSSSQLPLPPDERIPTTPIVHLPPGIQSPPASDADGSLTAFRRVDCPLRLRIDEALSFCREDDRDWSDAWRTHQPCSSSRRATLISHLCTDCEPAPEFLDLSPRWSPSPALESDQRSRRPTDKLQRGSDPSLLASHLNCP